MLTDLQIKKHIQAGKIRIIPFIEGSIGSGNYQVRLGHTLLIPKAGQTVDLRNPSPNIEYDRLEIDPVIGYLLKPKEFVLGQTLETIAMDNDVPTPLY